MKTLITFCFSLSMFIAASGQYRNAELQAAGLTCSLCSNAILKSLKALPFVAAVETELKSTLFKITFRPGIPVDFDLLGRKVQEAGFSVGRISVDIKFDKAVVKNDTHLTVGGQLFHFIDIKPGLVDGWTRVRLVDKSFVLASEYKKYSKMTSLACYKTGFRALCCPQSGQETGQRIFHVTI